MRFELPPNAKPSMAMPDAKGRADRPVLGSAYIIPDPNNDEWMELFVTDSYIMARVPIRVIDPAPDNTRPPILRLSYEAMRAVEAPRVRSFRVIEGLIEPTAAAGGQPLGVMYVQNELEPPEWRALMARDNGTPTEMFQYGIDGTKLHRLQCALGARSGLEITPGLTALRQIRVQAFGDLECYGLIMPVRLMS